MENETIKKMVMSNDVDMQNLGVSLLVASFSWKDYRSFMNSDLYLLVPYPIRKEIRRKMVEVWGKRDDNGKLVKKYGKL